MQFRILGPLEVYDGRRRLSLGGTKQRAALAVLMLHANQVVSRERLIDAVWSDSPPPTAGHTLDAYMSRLRKELSEKDSPPRVVTRRPGYLLRVDAGELDVDRFELLLERGRQAFADARYEDAAAILREGLTLFRGPPLEELAHARFAEAEAARLTELEMAAMEERIDADLALGRQNDLIPELRRLVERHPLRERLWGQLILALYRSGRQADALAAFEGVRRHLASELGVDPSRALQELRQGVLRQEPELDGEVDGATAVQGMQAPPVTEPAVTGSSLDRSSSTAPGRPRRGRVPLVAAGAVLLMVAAVSGWVVQDDNSTKASAKALGVSPGVSALDPRTGAVVALVSDGDRPTEVASGAGAVWVSNASSNTVSRIDSATDAVVPIKVGLQPAGIAVGAGSVWVADSGDATIARINTQSPFDVTVIPVRPGPSDVVVAAGSVWLTNSLDAVVTEIDPRTSRPTRTVPVGVAPVGIAFGAGSLWVVNQGDDTVTRIDPVTGRADEAPIKVGHGPVGVAYGAGAVWVTNNTDGSLSRIDPSDLSVTTQRLDAGGGAYGVAVYGDTVWASNQYGSSLTRLDARSFTVKARVPIRGSPLGLTLDDGRLWVASAGDDAVHRGGVLTIAADNIADGYRVLDPTDTYSLVRLVATGRHHQRRARRVPPYRRRTRDPTRPRPGHEPAPRRQTPGEPTSSTSAKVCTTRPAPP